MKKLNRLLGVAIIAMLPAVNAVAADSAVPEVTYTNNLQFTEGPLQGKGEILVTSCVKGNREARIRTFLEYGETKGFYLCGTYPNPPMISIVAYQNGRDLSTVWPDPLVPSMAISYYGYELPVPTAVLSVTHNTDHGFQYEWDDIHK